MSKIKIIVKGSTGTGKSHVLAVLERALVAEYGPLMKIECKELISERNLIGTNIDSWNKPNPTQVTISLEEENVPGRKVADLSKSRPIEAIFNQFHDFGDICSFSAILVDSIDPGISSALSTLLEAHPIDSVERTLARPTSIELTLTFDVKFLTAVEKLFAHLKELQKKHRHELVEYANLYLITTKADKFDRAMLVSLYTATSPTVRGDKGFITLAGIDASPLHVNQMARDAWNNRNKLPELIGYREMMEENSRRCEFVPSIKCPPFDK